MATDTAADTSTTTTREQSPWLTAAEAAARAKVGIKMVYRAIRDGKLRATRLGARNDIRVHESWVDAWLNASSTINPDAPGADLRPPLKHAHSPRR